MLLVASRFGPLIFKYDHIDIEPPPQNATATKEELKDLSDEGIKTEFIPWLEDKKN